VKRVIAVASIATISATGAVTAAAAGGGNHLDIPQVHRIQLVERHGLHQHVQARGSISGRPARRVIRDLNHLKAYPKHVVFNCVADRGRRMTATITSGADTWIVEVGTCGTTPFITKNNGKPRAYHQTKRFTADYNYAFALMRPRSEHVPATVDVVHIATRTSFDKPWRHRRTVTGEQASTLVSRFDHLRREPPNYVVCDIAGGPTQKVTFRSEKHTWVALQSSCSQIQIRRDGKYVPTLLSSPAWTKAVSAALDS
jgi:hypothetical protein